MSTDAGSDGEEVLVRPPAHPVPQLQGPFEESMVESVSEMSDHEVPADAVTRRTMLLDAPHYQRIIAGRWKQKPGENYHPLWKLVAQMSFGMHLLVRSMAKSEDEVMKILQSHVDDIDGFLERTTEDFDLAKSDVHERLRCLKLPLAHGEVFDRMLEDRNFRASILDGNEKIEHIINRTRKATKDSLKDVQKGFDATNLLDKYLAAVNKTWPRETPEHEAVFVAMLGNVEGWRRAFLELHLQGNKLVGSLKKLSEVVGEMQRRAATVARRILAKSQITIRSDSRNTPPQTSRSSTLKPLPAAPDQRPPRTTSSRGTPPKNDSSRPNSSAKLNQGRFSDSPTNLGSSPGSKIRKLNIDAQGPRTFFSSANNSPEIIQDWDVVQLRNKGKSPERGRATSPVELPADVPKEVMQQAPVSIKNRLSTTLGLEPRDKSEYRISSIYYPRALGDLLKIPPSPQVMLTPQLVNPRSAAVRSVTPNSGMSDAETDYFSTREWSPSIGIIVSESPRPNESPLLLQETPATSFLAGEDSDTLEDPDRPRSSSRNPAFTSHPSVLLMAQPPAELTNDSGLGLDHSKLQAKQKSRSSSLGEPGPSILEADIDQSSVSAIGSEKSHDNDRDLIPEIIEPVASGVTLQSIPERSSLKLSGPTSDQNAQTPTATPIEPLITRAEGDDKSDESRSEHKTADTSSDTATRTPKTVIELAALPSPTFSTSANAAFVELEAPSQHFILPPRTTETQPGSESNNLATSTQKEETISETIGQPVRRIGLKRRKVTESLSPQPIKPLKLKLTKKDGKMVPVPVRSPLVTDTEQRVSRVARVSTGDLIASILDTISSASSSSKNRERSVSDSSPHSPRMRMSARSKSLGPPDQAPAPPGPGGRSMVSPDFAAAGQFDGERKLSKRMGSVGGSASGWRTFLGAGVSKSNSVSRGGASVALPNNASATSPRDSTVLKRTSARGSGTDMLTSAGKDVLWFKDESNGSKKAVGVSS